MTAVALRASVLTAVKREISDLCPDIKSSHLTEALAAGLGFRTHAALLAFVAERGDFPEYSLFDDVLFARRLKELSSEDFPDDDENWFDWLEIDELGGLVPTEHPNYEPSTPNARRRAASAMLVAAVNEGIERRLFSLVADDNRWKDEGFGQGGYPTRRCHCRISG
jgi:hypothetical protein